SSFLQLPQLNRHLFGRCFRHGRRCSRHHHSVDSGCLCRPHPCHVPARRDGHRARSRERHTDRRQFLRRRLHPARSDRLCRRCSYRGRVRHHACHAHCPGLRTHPPPSPRHHLQPARSGRPFHPWSCRGQARHRAFRARCR